MHNEGAHINEELRELMPAPERHLRPWLTRTEIGYGDCLGYRTWYTKREVGWALEIDIGRAAPLATVDNGSRKDVESREAEREAGHDVD